MSYILDALKKAEQEREQGAVPGLHAQQVLAGDAPETAPGLSPLTWAGIGVALTLAGVLTWHNWPAKSDAPGGTVNNPPAMADGMAPPPGTGPNAAMVPPTAPGMRPGQPGGANGSAPSPRAPSAATRPAGDDVAMQVDGGPPTGTTRPWPAQATLSVPGPRGGEQGSSQRPARGTAPDGGAREPTGTLPSFAELPEALRKELPALSVGGAMHSTVRAQRMLVLNGQVLHEGDSPQPGLVLEEIRLKSAVLNLKGQRFELKF
jgi:general secretion pathway protein B